MNQRTLHLMRDNFITSQEQLSASLSLPADGFTLQQAAELYRMHVATLNLMGKRIQYLDSMLTIARSE